MRESVVEMLKTPFLACGSHSSVQHMVCTSFVRPIAPRVKNRGRNMPPRDSKDEVSGTSISQRKEPVNVSVSDVALSASNGSSHQRSSAGRSGALSDETVPIAEKALHRMGKGFSGQKAAHG